MEPKNFHIYDHRKLSDIFLAALELPPNARAEFLEKSCSSDQMLREKVIQMLRAHQAENTPLDEDFSQASLNLLPQAASLVKTLSENQPLPNLPRRPLLFNSIGSYNILAQVGQGGMGIVYKAVPIHQPQAPPVAIKLLQPMSQQETLVRRFQTESEILSRLKHPNIARFIETGHLANGTPYYVMEFIEGIAIDDYCDRHKLGINARLQLFNEVCSAVEYAHKKWVLHRDLKPSNILVTERGQVKLLDFGISKVIDPDSNTLSAMLSTRTTERMLTPAYASPEQIRGKLLTVAVDIYALGVLLYFLISGRLPYEFNDPTWSEIERIICEVEPLSLRKALISQGKPTAIAPALENIVLMALRKEPERRYPSVAALAADVDNYLQGQPVFARPASLTYRIQRLVRQHKRTSIATAIVLALTVVSGTLISQQVDLANSERLKADKLRKDNEEAAQEMVQLLSKFGRLQKGSASIKENEALIKEILQSLESLQQKSQNNPKLQLQIAAHYRSLGELQGRAYYSSSGNTQGALTSYRQSLEILEKLVQNQPESTELQLELALSLQRIGDFFSQILSDLPQGKRYTQQAIIIREKLRLTKPHLRENIEMLISCQVRMASMAESQGELASSLKIYNQLMRENRTLLQQSPTDEQIARILSLLYNGSINTLESIASCLGQRPTFSVAIKRIYNHTLTYSERIAKLCKVRLQLKPEDLNIQKDVDGSYLATGYHVMKAGQPATAIKFLSIALQRFEKSFAQDPDDIFLRRNLALTHLELGEAYAALNQPEKAKEHLQKSIAMNQDLMKSDAKDHISQEDLASTQVILAQVLNRQDAKANTNQIFENLAQAHQIYQALYQQSPTTSKTILDFLQNTQRYAQTLVQHNQLDEARSLVATALKTCQAHEQDKNVPLALQYAAYADLLLETPDNNCMGAEYAQQAINSMGQEPYLYVQIVQYKALMQCGQPQEAQILAQQIIDSLPLEDLQTVANTNNSITLPQKKD
jgi:eukaryotic-like serine/threonine-protein kinase